ncbi:FAD-binding protein [Moorellaceae bacterium AZ2]
MGVDPGTLKATIEQYNRGCERGYDELLGKDRQYLVPLRTPPYYAIKISLHLLVTHGGIRVNHHMQVVDGRGIPIEGLYALVWMRAGPVEIHTTSGF